MRRIDFEQLYLEDFHIHELFATDQQWRTGHIFATQRPRKTSALVHLQDCRAVYETSEGIREYTRGSVLYIPQNALYKTTFLADTQSFAYTQLIEFELRDKEGEPFACSERIICVDTDESGYYEEMFSQLTGIYRNFAYSYGEFRSVLYGLLAHIARNHRAERMYSKEFYAIAPALDRLTREPCTHETVADLAKMCHISESGFRMLFKKYSGKTPSEYCLEQKMKRARKLLRSNLYSVSQVAELLGFSDPGYFCKVFKKENGLSPKAFSMQEE